MNHKSLATIFVGTSVPDWPICGFPSWRRALALLCVAAVLCLWGCGSPRSVGGSSPPGASAIRTVLVVPFHVVTHSGKLGTTARCPRCGAVFQTGPVEVDGQAFLTRKAVTYLEEKTPYTIIPPEAAMGVRSKIISEDVAISERSLLMNTAKKLHADAVVSGVVFSFRQRVGSGLSIESPASVGFGVHLLRAVDGRLIWSRHFHETQKSLSENLFKLGTFVKRGGGWLTAEELAGFGLDEVMGTFPVP